jgi:hypothetical protein
MFDVRLFSVSVWKIPMLHYALSLDLLISIPRTYETEALAVSFLNDFGGHGRFAAARAEMAMDLGRLYEAAFSVASGNGLHEVASVV